jgi:polysaccharide biosynthesis/export protein
MTEDERAGRRRIRKSATLELVPNVQKGHTRGNPPPTGGFRAVLMIKSFLFVLVLVLGAIDLPAQQQEKTSSKELSQYVQDARNSGLKDNQIQQNAVNAGWPEALVKEAIASLRGAPKATAATADSKTAAPPASMAARVAVDEARPAPTPAAPGMPANAETRNAGGPEPGGAGSVKPAMANRGVPDEYRIGEGDILQVSVWGERDASVPSVVVRPDGMISMPLIKDVRVAGLTPAEAEKTITELLSKQIKAVDVTVIVSGINSKKVFFIGGGIKKEVPVPYTYRMTIMQAISEAGGLTDFAKRKKIYVLRNENGRQYKLAFDYDAVLKGQRMELNVPLLPGDTIVVPNH